MLLTAIAINAKKGAEYCKVFYLIIQVSAEVSDLEQSQRLETAVFPKFQVLKSFLFLYHWKVLSNYAATAHAAETVKLFSVKLFNDEE